MISPKKKIMRRVKITILPESSTPDLIIEHDL